MYDDNQQSGFDFGNQSNSNQSYQQQPQQYAPPQYQPPQYQQQPSRGYNSGGAWPPMKVGDWIITSLLLCIPIANIVLMFMWAFGSDVNPSKKSYFQAQLIFWAIGIVISILFSLIFAAAFASLFSSLFSYF